MKKTNLSKLFLAAFAATTMMFAVPGMEAMAAEDATGEVVTEAGADEEVFDFASYVGEIDLNNLGSVYVKNGQIDADRCPANTSVLTFTGVGVVLDDNEQELGAFYLTNGVWDTTYCDEGKWWGTTYYFTNGVGSTERNPVIIEGGHTGLTLIDDGSWVYLVDGVQDFTINGLIEYDGEWFYLEEGELDTTKTGLVEYDGGWFWVAAGRICREANGPIQADKTIEVDYCDDITVSDEESWIYMAEGQVQLQYTGLAEYDGEWFYLKKGTLDERKNGLACYNGRIFWLAAGRIVDEYSGLTQTGGFFDSGEWIYVSNGQLVDYSGLVLFEGNWFYVEDGILQRRYTGYVEHEGNRFYVVNGQMTTETENLPEESKIGSYVTCWYGLLKNGKVNDTDVRFLPYYRYDNEEGYEWGKEWSEEYMEYIHDFGSFSSGGSYRYDYGIKDGHIIHLYGISAHNWDKTESTDKE